MKMHDNVQKGVLSSYVKAKKCYINNLDFK